MAGKKWVSLGLFHPTYGIFTLRFACLMLGKGREVNFGFFCFFLIFFVFWVSHVFSFFFWYFPFILLDFSVNSDVFFTFVLFFLAVPCVSFFFGFCSFHFATFFVTTNETWVLLHLFVLHVLFCSSVFFLVLMFFVSSCCSWKRCGGERSHP